VGAPAAQRHDRGHRDYDSAKERDLAIGGVLNFYQHTAALADTHLAQHTRPAATRPASPPTAAPDLREPGQALAWIQAERANVLACINYAQSHGQHTLVVGLTASLASLLRSDGPWTQAIDLHTAAVAAARRCADRLGEANALHELGVVRYLTDDYPEAAQILQAALGIFRDLGNRLGEANALNYLGGVRQLTGDYPGAAQLLEQALGIHRDLGNRLGEAEGLNHSGTLCLKSGDPRQALAHHQLALGLARAVHSPREEARALEGSGRCALAVGQAAAAVAEFRRALVIYQRIGAAESTRLAADLADLEAE
jgi:tetratricopeptide (TPR) repeat protein